MEQASTGRLEKHADLTSIGAGAAGEKFLAELRAVVENIRDPNTQPDARRKIIMTWEFEPNEDREVVMIAITARSVFAATKPTSDIMYLGRQNGEDVATVVHGEPVDPRQGVLPLTKSGERA